MISGINYINLKERFIHMFMPEVVQVKPNSDYDATKCIGLDPEVIYSCQE